MKTKKRMITYREFQKLAKEDNKKIPHRDIYYPVLSLFMEYLSEQLLNEGLITLPYGLGKLCIIGCTKKIKFKDNKIVGLPVDWLETKKLWERDKESKKNKQLVFFLNEHTNGIMYSFRWYRTNVYSTNKNLYDFRPCRGIKKKLCNNIKSGKEYLLRELI